MVHVSSDSVALTCNISFRFAKPNNDSRNEGQQQALRRSDEIWRTMCTSLSIRRNRLFYILFVVAYFNELAIAIASEGCPTNQSEIATDRPDVTNSSVVVPTGSLQSESGINLTGRESARIFDGTNSRLRLGIASCLEILVDLPNYVATIHGQASSGFSNVIPAVKWQFNPLPGEWKLSVTAGAGLPTGTPGIAGHGVQPYLQFPWSRELSGGWGISGMFTNFFLPADPSNKLITEATFVIEKKVGDRGYLFVEYVGDFPEHAPPIQLLNSGAAYLVTPTQQIDVHVAFGLNRNSPTYIFGLGYSFRLDRLF